MGTPKLSQKAINSTLSAKKSKKRETIKNVLASPYETYWPEITHEQSDTIKRTLQNHPALSTFNQIKVPWFELKKVPKTERKAFKENFRKSKVDENLLPEKPKRDGIILGINDITKSLENQVAKAVLITNDVRPKLMVKHVISQAGHSNIPVLIVTGLREMVKQACQINTVAISFTDSPTNEAVLLEIHNIAQMYPVTNKHINFERSRKEMECSVIVLDDSDVSSSKIGKSGTIDFEQIYLKKSDPHKRVFTPGKDSVLPMESSTGFLSLTTDISSTRESFLQNYVPLKVKRIQGDPNRKKRKIVELKDRLKIKKKSKAR